MKCKYEHRCKEAFFLSFRHPPYDYGPILEHENLSLMGGGIEEIYSFPPPPYSLVIVFRSFLSKLRNSKKITQWDRPYMSTITVLGLNFVNIRSIDDVVNELWACMIRIPSCVKKFHEFIHPVRARAMRIHKPHVRNRREPFPPRRCICCDSG